MKYTQARKGTPHLFRLGTMRTILGARCVLIGYTPGKNPRPRYRRLDNGKTVTVYERRKWR